MENPELIQETIDALENGTGGSTGCVTDIVNCHDQMVYMSDQTGLSAEEIEEIINPGGGFNPLCDCTEDPESGSFEECVEERVCEDIEEKIFPNISDSRIQCIYDKMWNNAVDNIWCYSITNFLGTTKVDLYIDSHISASVAQVTPLSEDDYGQALQLTMNPYQLDGYCEVTVTGIFLHEAIHAEMWRQIKNPDIDPNDVQLIWGEYDLQSSQHENMTTYINAIVNALKMRFGNRYSDLEYEAIAWRGLGNVDGENVNTKAWKDLSESKKNQLIAAFERVNEDCSDDDCK